jgi:hypothetical protein
MFEDIISVKKRVRIGWFSVSEKYPLASIEGLEDLTPLHHIQENTTIHILAKWEKFDEVEEHAVYTDFPFYTIYAEVYNDGKNMRFTRLKKVSDKFR